MDYRVIVMDKLNEYADKFPEYSVGELLYSIFTHSVRKVDIKTSDFLKLKDQDFYTMIEVAIEKEKQ